MSTIYLSSTYEDLKNYREAAGRGLRRLNHQVIGMEDYVAADERPLDQCLADVGRCDIYVGLFAHRYGFIPTQKTPDGKSMTELEYREAARLGKPRLIFILDGDTPWLRKFMDAVTGEADGGAKIDALRAELADGHVTGFFHSPDNLESIVTAAVARHTQQVVITAPPKLSMPEPRQIEFDGFLLHDPTDDKLSESLIHELLPDPDRCVVRSSSRGLFARTSRDYIDLEVDLCRSALAAVLVSPITLDKMEEERKRTELVLETLRSRTGGVVALASTAESAVRAATWQFTNVFDISKFETTRAEVVRRLKQELKRLGRVQTPPAIGLPWMIVAMTEAEARSLLDDPGGITARMGESVRQQFEAVRAGLENDWLERYRERRDQWYPPGSASTIAVLSRDAVANLTQSQNVKLRGRQIQLQYYPFDTLVADRDELRPVYRDVAEKGCVMIVDELSLFHPDVNDALQRSPMVSAKHTAIITVSPFEHYALPPHKAVWRELKQRLSGAFDRFALDYDPQCELSVGDEYRLRRWLNQSLPETVETLRKPPANRAALLAFADEENLELDPAAGTRLFAPGAGL